MQILVKIGQVFYEWQGETTKTHTWVTRWSKSKWFYF